jgi:hypothetical protein
MCYRGPGWALPRPFLYLELFFTIKKAWVVDAHAHIQRLVSVVTMATVFEECVTEDQLSVVHFCGQKDSMQKIFVKKCVMFTVGSVCRFKLFTTGSRNSLKDVRKSQMMPDQVALLRLRQKKLCSGWKS